MSITPSNLNSSKASVVPHSEIGTAVRRSREAIGYTIADLSETCGLTQDEISEIELGADAGIRQNFGGSRLHCRLRHRPFWSCENGAHPFGCATPRSFNDRL